MKFYTQLFTLIFVLAFSQTVLAQSKTDLKKASPSEEISAKKMSPEDRDAQALIQFLKKVNGFNAAFDAKDEQKCAYFKKALVNDMENVVKRNTLKINQSGYAAKKKALIQESDEDNPAPATGINEVKMSVGEKAVPAKPQPSMQRSLQSHISKTAKQKQILTLFKQTNFNFDAKNEKAAQEGRVLLQDFVASMKMDVPNYKAKAARN